MLTKYKCYFSCFMVLVFLTSCGHDRIHIVNEYEKTWEFIRIGDIKYVNVLSSSRTYKTIIENGKHELSGFSTNEGIYLDGDIYIDKKPLFSDRDWIFYVDKFGDWELIKDMDF